MEFTNISASPDGQNGKPWWRQPWAYAAAALVVLAGVAVTVSLIGGSKRGAQPDKNSTAVYYDRAGFDRQKLSSGIGDPAALELKKTSQPVSYQGTKIIQACSVFGPTDVRGAGLRIKPNQLAVAFNRSFFDGQGQGILRPSSDVSPSTGDTNSCQYTVESSAGSQEYVWIDVYQPPYVPATAITMDISRRFHSASQIGGLAAFTRTSQTAGKTDTYTVMRAGSAAVQVTTNLQDGALAKAVLEKAATNFQQLLNAPDGAAKVAYASPLMPDGYANACELLTADDVKTLFGAEASPIAKETASTAIGVIQFGSGKEARSDNYVEHSCERKPVITEQDALSFNTRKLNLETTTYRNEEAARQDMAFHRGQDQGVTAVTSKVGDEAFFSNATGFKEQLTLRQGRVVLHVSVSDKRLTQDQKLPQHVKLGQAIMGRLKLQ